LPHAPYSKLPPILGCLDIDIEHQKIVYRHKPTENLSNKLFSD
jgi:hypothetical protein